MITEGTKVVRVDDKSIPDVDFSNFEIIGSAPIEGAIYVVRKVVMDPEWPTFGLILIGSSVKYIPSGLECGWDARCFRELDELKKLNKKHQIKSK